VNKAYDNSRPARDIQWLKDNWKTVVGVLVVAITGGIAAYYGIKNSKASKTVKANASGGVI